MGRRKNDGLGKFGGRKKGTPNKTTNQRWVKDLLSTNRGIIEQRFLNAPGEPQTAIVYAALSLAAALDANTKALQVSKEESIQQQ